MAITVATALTQMRAMVRDSSTAPGFTDANGMVMLNIAHLWWNENMERRTTAYSSGNEFVFVTGGDQDWDPGTYYNDIEFEKDAAEIVEIGLEASLNGVGVAGQSIVLERLAWSELRMRQNSDATLAQPTHWAALKLNGSHRWRLALYPLSNYATGVVPWRIIGEVRHQPTALSATTNKIDLGDSETDSIVTIASALMAPRMGRKALGDHLWSVLPKVVQDKLETTRVHDEVRA